MDMSEYVKSHRFALVETTFARYSDLMLALMIETCDFTRRCAIPSFHRQF